MPMPLVSITDISAYLFCPRKVFYRLVHRRFEPQNLGALKGSMAHAAIHHLLEHEARMLKKAEKPSVGLYTGALMKQLGDAVEGGTAKLAEFNVKPQHCMDELAPMVMRVAEQRAERAMELAKKGLSGAQVAARLEPKLAPEISLASNSIGLKGKVDCLELWKDKIIPVDFKTSSLAQPQLGDILQTTGYIMLVRGNYPRSIPVPYGVLRYIRTGNDIVIEESEENKKQILEIADRIRDMIMRKVEPEPCKNKFCSVCAPDSVYLLAGQ